MVYIIKFLLCRVLNACLHVTFPLRLMCIFCFFNSSVRNMFNDFAAYIFSVFDILLFCHIYSQLAILLLFFFRKL